MPSNSTHFLLSRQQKEDYSIIFMLTRWSKNIGRGKTDACYWVEDLIELRKSIEVQIYRWDTGYILPGSDKKAIILKNEMVNMNLHKDAINSRLSCSESEIGKMNIGMSMRNAVCLLPLFQITTNWCFIHSKSRLDEKWILICGEMPYPLLPLLQIGNDKR